MNTVRNLNDGWQNMMKSMAKLSSGFRINSAADDPAGLVISEQMRARIASLNQEIENTSITINKYQTADSAALQLRETLVEIRTLAVGAANSAVNDESITAAYQAEADDLVTRYNGIVDNAAFGTQKLFDGSDGSLADVTALSRYDLSSPEKAEDTVAAIDKEIAVLDGTITELGATEKNGLESRLANLRVEAENLTAAESQIRDTDYFQEYSNLVRNRLVVQAAVSLLSHGNITGQSVLRLLGGM
jgi:flagellin